MIVGVVNFVDEEIVELILTGFAGSGHKQPKGCSRSRNDLHDHHLRRTTTKMKIHLSE